MSQWYIGTTAGSLPPTVPTSFVTDINSPAIPIANVLNVFGNDTTANNNNGIETDGSSGSNTLTVLITNRIQNTITTANATPTALSTFSLGATPAVFTFDVNIAGFDTTDSLGIGYSIFGTIRTDGATATLVGSPDKIVNEESAAVFAADANLVVSGNNAIIQVTGIAATNINWNSVSTYVQVN